MRSILAVYWTAESLWIDVGPLLVVCAWKYDEREMMMGVSMDDRNVNL
jgi:hypothetical protein